MNEQPAASASARAVPNPMTLAQQAMTYGIDAWQRSVLLLDVLGQRTENYRVHTAKVAPHVLKFDFELIVDGHRLPRPVNYVLVRVKPPAGVEIDDEKRPFVIVDPRAGHGPGIGGFKPQSEIGVALQAGHPCYLIGFLPDPVPGQTIADIARAEAAFLEQVAALHPNAEGKPAVIGNCQAGWAVMMLAAIRPELFGPIIVAGSPLSYWAGVQGMNPMRYTGGLLGGSWLAGLISDLGNGKFDGAWLVTNFENMNPANTYWTKLYNVYSKIDTEPPRFLEFEQWWGGHVLLNAAEIQFIVDELFVGNKLATGEIELPVAGRIDLRNIRSPIVVFCSRADDITPPQQALHWILDLYESVDDIRAHGQTIVYAVHESIGHLGIFVSGSVAKKEHGEFASNIDLIDVLPPGLYEAVMTPKDPLDPSAELVTGDYLVRFEARTLEDIRALGCNDEEDERRFAAVARLSEINLGLYRTFVQPWVRGWANEGFARAMRRLHPLRLQYELFSSANPFMHTPLSLAQQVRENRTPVPTDNVFWQAQEQMSEWITASLDAYRDMRDHAMEAWFRAAYGSPAMQALVGLKASDASPRRGPGKSADHAALVAQRIQELTESIPHGGPTEAAIRSLLYIRMPDGNVDERSFRFLQRMRDQAGKGLTLAAFKRILREQYFMLLLDQERAVEAIPDMLAQDPDLALELGKRVRQTLEVTGLRSQLAKERMAEIEEIFKIELRRAAPEIPDQEQGRAAPIPPVRSHAAKGAKRV